MSHRSSSRASLALSFLFLLAASIAIVNCAFDPQAGSYDQDEDDLQGASDGEGYGGYGGYGGGYGGYVEDSEP